MNSTLNQKIFLGVAVGASLLLSCGSAALTIYDHYYNNPTISIHNYADGNSVNFTEGSIADIAHAVSSSVVSILTETRTTGYFGQSYTSSAAGTGMIISADGYVLTNKHVVDGASNINVILDDGTTFTDIKLVGVDPLNDAAFLKINGASGLSPVTFGDSKTISVGQQVIAVGNALGQYQNSVTSGIISGTGRSITATDSSYTTSETLTDMIQTDAAINPGNSGGPLINAAGEVIGINTATSANADGIGFAIPISSVKGMIDYLFATGTVSRAYIGIYYTDNTVSSVIKDSPAAKAGLKANDVITSVNGVSVGAAGSISTLIGEYKIGDTVQLSVLRDGKELSLKLTLTAYSK